jgi:AraC family transcriptional regulator of adaptative response / DNA-3-methyladenine glycosylase II
MGLDHDACYRAACQRDARFDGRFFTAVRTTGIYCRPVCSARTPQSKNVTFFPTAAAAQEAGYRPCLRCRPETAPDIGAWRGTSNTVTRALGLIELGALDQADVDALAGRLGLGDRQLRRLFRQHLGASPVAVAQTRRVLLAKQLIHETRLPMAEVAFAAGFGSIRRFNEAFLALFGRAPSELRRESQPDVPAGPHGQIDLLLRYHPPYDWPAMLQFVRQRAIPGIEVVTANGYARTVELDGVVGTVSVEPASGTASGRTSKAAHGPAERSLANALRATVGFPTLSALPAIIARLRRVFDLAADPSAIADHLAEDPMLAPLVKARPGLRVPGAWDGFELAMRAVLGQQITVSAAQRLAGKLVAAHGKPLGNPPANADGGLTHVFPRPEALAKADLTSLGMPRSRAAALSAVAAAAIADKHLFDATADLDDAVERLRSIRGVGEWTAQYIALRQLREPDAFPAADVGLLRAILDHDGRPHSSAELLQRAEAWRPWRAYAAQHLWASSPPSKQSSAASRIVA